MSEWRFQKPTILLVDSNWERLLNSRGSFCVFGGCDSRVESTSFITPPAGPNKVPIYRDIIILLSVRWLFAKTIFHMQASGGSEFQSRMNGFGRFLFRWAYGRPDAVIRLSEFTVDDATNYAARQQFIVPNCADDELDRFAQDESRNHDGIHILYVGTVCETKGILDLLEAAYLLKQREIPFHLSVVGGFQPDSFGAEVKRKVEQLELDQEITLHGQLTGDDKFQQFAAADVFCFPTFYESEAFPCVIVEAFSFGLPVVATRWRGIPSIVEHEKTGVLIEPRDINSLSDALASLATNQEIREQWGQASRERFVESFFHPTTYCSNGTRVQRCRGARL